MIIISDTSLISGLIIVGESELLFHLFDEILIPQEVQNELFKLIRYKEDVNIFLNRKQIIITESQDTVLLQGLYGLLDKGEAEAINLAIQLSANLLLIDEKRGRIIAQQLGLKIMGVLGLLLLAKKNKLIVDVKTIMDALQKDANFWIGEKLYKQILLDAGEN